MSGKKLGMGSHQSAKMNSCEWLTPPGILEALEKFDLDPCSPINRPWDTAKKHYTKKDNGFIQSWSGRIWLNPPYGSEAGKWLKKLSEHGNGIALIFARTETKMFFNYVWPCAHAIMFIEGRLFFHYPDGTPSSGNAGAPSCLVAYGEKNAEILKQSKIQGFYVDLHKKLIKKHTEKICCPRCALVQKAEVEHTWPFPTYIHYCEKCNYIIMESEWEEIHDENTKS